jgi:protein involved in polysaccharide export with SLBB domain
MRRYKLFLFLFAGLLVLGSCRFRKDLTYLADMKNDSLLINFPVTAPNYILKPDDNLYVTIQSANEEINKIYNVNNTTQGGGSQSYTDPAGQYIYGNIVDKQGLVTLPVLGPVQVSGLTVSEAQAVIQLRKQRECTRCSGTCRRVHRYGPVKYSSGDAQNQFGYKKLPPEFQNQQPAIEPGLLS